MTTAAAQPIATPTDSSQPAGTPPPQGQTQPNSNVSGAEAVALVEEAKTKGVSVKELMQSKGRSKAEPADEPEEGDAPKEAAQKQETKPEPKRYRVKVDGEEQDVDEDELLRGYSHQRAANKMLQEGKMARKQAEEFITLMKNPEKYFEVASKLGHDPRDLAEKFLASKLKEELMDPRERELLDVKKKLAHMEDMEKKSQDVLAKQRHDELKTKYHKDFETQFVQALQQSQVPATKETVGEMAKYISRAAKLKFRMSPSEAAQLVHQDIQRAQSRMYKNADADTLLKTLGDDVAKKLLEARGSQVKKFEQTTPKEQGAYRQRKPKATTRMSSKEWRDYNRA